MSERYGASHALKSPPHITLQMPFRRNSAAEWSMARELERFAENEPVFPVKLSGFDCFSPRVIFVQIENHQPIISLHTRLAKELGSALGFSDRELSKRIHPHMTIATRDLTVDAFLEAWPEFENRPFNATFQAESITLLKHNGKFWDVYKEFEFGKKKKPK